MEQDKHFLSWIKMAVTMVWVVLILCSLIAVLMINPEILEATNSPEEIVKVNLDSNGKWAPPDSASIPDNEEGRRIRYGKQLISHTAAYLGPNGSVMNITNGMNCQNCHLEAGTKRFGNNYAAVLSTYPKFRARSGSVESIEKRVNDCIQRSLNGKPLEQNSEELKSFVAYIKWVGSEVPKDSIPEGTGIATPEFLNRPADPVNGKIIFSQNCTRCHGNNGEGMRVAGSAEWLYPPISGPDSYNSGAGLFRLSRFAGYVKYNMPNDLASPEKPFLSDEQCWDVAAYVNALPRPGYDISADWPDISKKPFDHPFGPFSDGKSEKEHKYGPWQKQGK
jgi:thiosulfate dehydrogenase